MPKLSVIVPVYNAERYLRECIDSILSQTFADFELILVNDGSADRSGYICEEYAREDQRIRVIHQENAGVTAARKAGALCAIGDYMTYVDSDDWIDRDTYANVMTEIAAHNADAGVFGILVETAAPAIIGNHVGEGFFDRKMLREQVHPRMLFDYSSNRSGMIASLCNKLIKRELLQKAIASVSDGLDYGEDAISAYLSLLNASSAYICNHPYYHYRDNPGSITHAGSEVMKKRILTLDRDMRNSFAEYGEEMLRQVDGHIARHTVEQVRSDLVDEKDMPLQKRCRMAQEFCAQPVIAKALKKAYPNICDKKEKIKVFLIRQRLFGLLYLLFNRV